MLTSSKAKILQLVDSYCQNAKAGQLKSFSFLIGAANGTTKELRRTNIQKQCEFLEQLRQQKTKQGRISILSMDAGVSNFAFSKFQLDVYKRQDATRDNIGTDLSSTVVSVHCIASFTSLNEFLRHRMVRMRFLSSLLALLVRV